MANAATSRLWLCWFNADSAACRKVVDQPLGLTREGQTLEWPASRHDEHAERGGSWIVLRAVQCASGAICAALVPPRLARQPRLNDLALAGGLHLLRHADRLSIGGQTYWCAAHTSVIDVAYEPQLHGEDLYCFLTKARLHPAQRIKICPGIPGRACGAIYKAEAWDLAMQGSRPMKCPNCGYFPGLDAWEPPRPRPARDRLHDLLQIIRP